jgi:hypothetical protein
MSGYYQLKQREHLEDGSIRSYYACLIHCQGAWNPHEQHMAPAGGILAHELALFNPREQMRIGRIGYDILGLIPFGEFYIETKVIRAGKTIELLEATMIANMRPCIVARAWRMQTQNTQTIAGLEDHFVTPPEQLPLWDGMKCWPGGYIQSITARADQSRRGGQGIVWLNTQIPLVEGEETLDFVRLMGLVDTANGVVPRVEPGQGWAFPNLDLQVHLYRQPQGQWLGIQATQQYGSDGIGLTSSVLHDELGPFGRSEQILTLRAM